MKINIPFPMQFYKRVHRLTVTKMDHVVPALDGSTLLVTICDNAGQPNPTGTNKRI